jgi:7-cyano-7-deazaguanine synthase
MLADASGRQRVYYAAMERCVVLLSGGLDSATALAVARSQGLAVSALTVLYGQRHAVEVECAKRIATAFQAHDHRFVRIELDAIGGSALTDDIDVPAARDREAAQDIPVTYVPARNTVFLSVALGYAEVVGAGQIFIGVNAVDYSGYPDCRPEFIQAFEALAQVATKVGVEGRGIQISAPLLHLTKSEIIRLGLDLGVDYGMTSSCYDPDPHGRACGRCESCAIRTRAFADLGLRDPAQPPEPHG